VERVAKNGLLGVITGLRLVYLRLLGGRQRLCLAVTLNVAPGIAESRGGVHQDLVVSVEHHVGSEVFALAHQLLLIEHADHVWRQLALSLPVEAPHLTLAVHTASLRAHPREWWLLQTLTILA